MPRAFTAVVLAIAPRRRVEGTLGAGGPDLRLRTVNGSITTGPPTE